MEIVSGLPPGPGDAGFVCQLALKAGLEGWKYIPSVAWKKEWLAGIVDHGRKRPDGGLSIHWTFFGGWGARDKLVPGGLVACVPEDHVLLPSVTGHMTRESPRNSVSCLRQLSYHRGHQSSSSMNNWSFTHFATPIDSAFLLIRLLVNVEAVTELPLLLPSTIHHTPQNNLQ
jgi:hypothetical protein